MAWRWLAAVCALATAACGRIGFDSLDASGGDAASPDAMVSACPVGPVIPPSLSLSGVIIDGAAGTPIDAAMVELTATFGGAALATTSTDAAGMWDLTIPTGGMPIVPRFRLSASGYLTELTDANFSFAMDASGAMGDLAAAAVVAEYYGAVGATQDAGAGLLIVVPTDCSGNLQAGVAFTSNPAMAFTYLDPGGTADLALTATTSEGVAVVVNAPVGTLEITASGTASGIGRAQVAVSPTLSWYALAVQ